MSRSLMFVAALALSATGAWADPQSLCNQEKDLNASIAACAEIIASGVAGKELARAHANRGLAYGLKGEFDSAFADLNKAIEIHPNLSAAYANRCLVYGHKKEFDLAIADCDEAIALTAKNADAYAARGYAYLRKGERDKAIADYRKALEIDPSNGDATSSLKNLGPTSLPVATAAQPTPGMAQTELTIPGGATGANVFCIQAGSLTSGEFVETFVQTDTGAWEQRSKADTFKFKEKTRDDVMVELFDESRSTAVQFDFVGNTIREKPSSSKAIWADRYVILNATDKAASKDCVSSAAHSTAAATPDADADESDEAEEANLDDSSTKAEEPSKQPAKAKTPSKPRTRAKTTSKPRKKSRSASKRRKAPQKKKSGSGFSIGVGIGGVGIGF